MRSSGGGAPSKAFHQKRPEAPQLPQGFRKNNEPCVAILASPPSRVTTTTTSSALAHSLARSPLETRDRAIAHSLTPLARSRDRAIARSLARSLARPSKPGIARSLEPRDHAIARSLAPRNATIVRSLAPRPEHVFDLALEATWQLPLADGLASGTLAFPDVSGDWADDGEPLEFTATLDKGAPAAAAPIFDKCVVLLRCVCVCVCACAIRSRRAGSSERRRVVVRSGVSK